MVCEFAISHKLGSYGIVMAMLKIFVLVSTNLGAPSQTVQQQ